MTSPSSSHSSLRRRLQQKMPGNLALCSRTASTNESENLSCLGWIDTNIDTSIDTNVDTNINSVAAMKPLTNQDPLNWHFRDGLLRAVGTDGFATDLCLGPTLLSLEANSFSPYELVLQDCPYNSSNSAIGRDSITENIFDHDTFRIERRSDENASAPATARSVNLDEKEKQEQQQQQQQHDQDQLQQRHMRFIIGGDGRVRSLAPVFDPDSPKKDIVAEQPFCVTADMDAERAYLVPCFEHQDETHVYNNNSNNTLEESSTTTTHRIFKGEQQLFQPDARTSFDSFLLNFDTVNNAETTQAQELRLAYQIGYHGPFASHYDPTFDRFDSFAIRVTDEKDSTTPAVFESTLSQQSGIRTFPLSKFGISTSNGNGEQTNMGAYLLGRSSTGSVPTGVLASTSFLVANNIETPLEELSTAIPSISKQQPQTPIPKAQAPLPQQQQPASINWPWAHFLFWGFMVCFAILVKAKSIFRPSQKEPHWKTVLRESVNTVDTNAATLASVDSHELHDTQQQQPQAQQQQPKLQVNVQHHQKRQLRRKSRRKSRTLPREVYDWDESAHSRSNSSSSSSNNNISFGSVRLNGIDATQPTVTPSEYSSSSNGRDDTVRSDLLDLASSDAEDDNYVDDDDSYDEYDDDDIEAR